MKKKSLISTTVVLAVLLIIVVTVYTRTKHYDRLMHVAYTESENRIEICRRSFMDERWPELIVRKLSETESTVWQLTWDRYFDGNRDLADNQYIVTDKLLIFPLTRVDENGYCFREITAIDHRMGVVAWSTPVPAGIDHDGFSSMSDGSSLFVFNLDRMRGPLLTRLDIQTGEEFWTAPAPAYPGAPLMTDDYFILHYSFGGFSRAFIYSKEEGLSLEIPVCYPGFVRGGDFLYIGKDREQYCVHRTNMMSGEDEELFVLQDQPYENQPFKDLFFALSGDMLLFQGRDQSFKALSLADGRRIWETRWKPDNQGREYLFTFFGDDILEKSPVHCGFYDMPEGYFPLVLQSQEKKEPYERLVVLDSRNGQVVYRGNPIPVDLSITMNIDILYKEGKYFITGKILSYGNKPYLVFEPFVFVMEEKTGDFISYAYLDPAWKTNQEYTRFNSLSELILGGGDIIWNTEDIDMALSARLGISP
ncbi:PQQ-binding-like beta-propeller repeat protein [Marispirochaeta sp.]|uniref:outer membrane protein assembly factor BamB family protein n=1 Tax=Marispirochaeta sp. TaxID=2038653 RepID=UPI0029C9AD6D|nr:PQQ-binding-like beta-propeller repeat protein [Marispirochaeta sp.]